MSQKNEEKLADNILELRKACRQFAMLYFHFCKVFVDDLGLEEAKPKIQKAIFSLAVDRSTRLREVADEKGLPYTMDTFMQITDLPFSAWRPELGCNHCPYAETWFYYQEKYPWFKELAPLYCDVIDTSNAEVFTGDTSHHLYENVLTGGDYCNREYYPSDQVKKGELTYGFKE